MNAILRANIRTNLRFYARNRLMLIIALLFGLVLVAGMIPSIFLTSTLFALNFLGDGLRDALDPKDR